MIFSPSQFRPAWLLFGLLAFGLLWASQFELEQTVHAQGQIMPVTRTQVIQAADGGVLEKLHVQEGESVKAGQLLATLEKERANAGVDEGAAKVAALSAALTRARAEARGTAPVFDKALKKWPQFITEQQLLFEQKRATLDDELSVLKDSLKLATEESELSQKLFATGDISRFELMRAHRQVVELSGRITSTRNKYLQDARAEAAKLQEELESQRFKLEDRQSVLQHTELTAPVAGVVKTLRINTVGGVLRAGDELMQISPTDVELMVEAKVPPADIGLLRTGRPVSIKLDPFDYSIYGSLQGELSYISADTLTEQAPNGQAQTFYRVQIKFNTEQDNRKLQLNDLKPGMTANVDVLTGSRSVLTYLTKPITKAFQGAASQR